jgi:subfamily B ATP-binding cassette protein MsbA
MKFLSVAINNFKKNKIFFAFNRLNIYFGSQKKTWFWVWLSVIVGAATEPMVPALLKPLLDHGFKSNTFEIWKVPVFLLALFAIRGLSGYISQIGINKITNKGLFALRKAMFNKLLFSKIQLFNDENSSSISNTVVFEVQNGSYILVSSILSLVRNGLTLIALTAYLFYLNWQLTLVIAAIFPAIALVMRVLTRRVHRLSKTTQNATDNLAYTVEENVLAHKEVRLYGAQKIQTERFNSSSEILRHLSMRSTVAGAAMTPLTQMLAAIALSIVICIALIQSSLGATSVGSFVAFITAMLMIIAPIRQLSEVASPITRGLVALEKGLALVENNENEKEGVFYKQRATGAIHFSQASVRYKHAEKLALNKIELSIQSGETIALVGASGSGKTTLINLLPRFLDLEDGHIFLDNVDIREWSLMSLRTQFSMVSQHVVMFNASLADNISLGMPVDRKRVLESLRAANLEDLIAELPLGIDSAIGHNATQLSGGQRQRLAIARAIYKDSPILILDEATSALDTESEKMVQTALQTLMKGRTTLIVAHRLSTIRHADRIVVIDNGNIVEVGSHADLMVANGFYAKLQQSGIHSI